MDGAGEELGLLGEHDYPATQAEIRGQDHGGNVRPSCGPTRVGVSGIGGRRCDRHPVEAAVVQTGVGDHLEDLRSLVGCAVDLGSGQIPDVVLVAEVPHHRIDEVARRHRTPRPVLGRDRYVPTTRRREHPAGTS